MLRDKHLNLITGATLIAQRHSFHEADPFTSEGRECNACNHFLCVFVCCRRGLKKNIAFDDD